jgi:capsid assembly protease
MKTPHLLARALSEPWALMPERMAAYASVLASHYAGTLPPAKPRDPEAAAPSRSVSGPRSGGIAVIPVFGAMVEWASDIDICDGGTSTRQIAQALAEAEQDETVGQILMVFNTPGGSVYGITELASAINRVKATKPVVGVAQSLAASAGYWALSQCTQAYCAPGGEVGSIGVYSGYENIAKALEMAGVSVELLSAGQYKTELSPFSKDGLSEDARAYQLQRANDYYAAFTGAVSKGRGVPIAQVRDGMGQGRVLGADAALAAGMIDGVMPMEDVLKKMQRDARGARSASARGAHADLDLSTAAADVAAIADAAQASLPPRAVDSEAVARSAAARRRDLELLNL